MVLKQDGDWDQCGTRHCTPTFPRVRSQGYQITGRTANPTVRGKTDQSSGLWTLNSNVVAEGEKFQETFLGSKSGSLVPRQAGLTDVMKMSIDNYSAYPSQIECYT